jgi:D-beta-D-heptose 7-phosphate kinase/D-beta-D-heptose 1-phosphate adenosyltransferase
MDFFDADLLYELEQFAPTPDMPRLLASLASEIVVVGDSTLREGAAPGAAAGIAVCLAGLGAKVELLSVCGNDLDGVLLHKRLIGYGVDTSGLVIEAGRRTDVTRLPSGVQPIRACTGRLVRGMVDTAGRDADCVLIVDHQRGLITHQVRHAIMALAVGGQPLVVDAATGDGPSEIAVPDGGTCLTLLEDGGTLLSTAGKGPYRTWAPRRRGRGDAATESAIAMFTLGLVAELPATTSAELAQVTADVTAGLPSANVCTTARLTGRLARYKSAALPPSDLVRLAHGHRRAGRRIVFTSGSFDSLHNTDVEHLNRARLQGDVLVAAVHSDTLVRRRNKSRPLRPARCRAAALAALSCVDHVTITNEEVPVELLDRLRPDVCLCGFACPRDGRGGRKR